jgi:hypothetical protein
MTKARFYIKDKPLQGLRVSPSWACGVVGQSPTMEKILNSGLNLNGTAINAGLNVPDSDSMRSPQALMHEQLSKGIETGISKMKNRIVYIVGRIRSKLHSSYHSKAKGVMRG